MTVRLFHLSRLPPSARKPALIKRACLAALQKGKAAARTGELNVVFMDRKGMLAMNKRFLKHGHDTDVISFLYQEPGRPAPEAPFGDVFVSAHQARTQARRLGHPVLKEVLALAIHGTLHLLGYDDRTKGRKARMFMRQDAVLRGLRL